MDVHRKGQADRDESARKLKEQLVWLESLVSKEGPYFLGKQFGAIDCAILPWFIRLYVLKHFRNFELPKECKALVAW